MDYHYKTLKQAGWRNWLNDNPAPDCMWAASEFNVLYKANAPVTVFMRIWHKSRPTMEKWLADRTERGE